MYQNVLLHRQTQVVNIKQKICWKLCVMRFFVFQPLLLCMFFK